MSWKHIYGPEIYKNKTNGNILSLLYAYFFIDTFYLFVDILVQCEQLDEFDSEDETDSTEEEFKKSNILPYNLSSNLMIPEQ